MYRDTMGAMVVVDGQLPDYGYGGRVRQGLESRGRGYGRATPLAAMASQPPAYARAEGSAMATVDESPV